MATRMSKNHDDPLSPEVARKMIDYIVEHITESYEDSLPDRWMEGCLYGIFASYNVRSQKLVVHKGQSSDESSPIYEEGIFDESKRKLARLPPVFRTIILPLAHFRSCLTLREEFIARQYQTEIQVIEVVTKDENGEDIQQNIFRLEAFSSSSSTTWTVIASDTESDLSWILRYGLGKMADQNPKCKISDLVLPVVMFRKGVGFEFMWKFLSQHDLEDPMVKIQNS